MISSSRVLTEQADYAIVALPVVPCKERKFRMCENCGESHKPNIQESLREDYAKNGVILLFGKIEGEKVGFLRHWLMRLALSYSGSEIKLIIDSPGGSVLDGFKIFDLIRSLPKKVIGIVNGQCNSMAPVILQACAERISLPHSTFLLHNISQETRYSLFDAKARFDSDYKMTREFQEQIVEILQKRSNLPREKIVELITRGDEVHEVQTVKDALELNLIDRVVEQFEILPAVKIITQKSSNAVRKKK